MLAWEKFSDESIAEIAKAKDILSVGSGKRFSKGLEKFRPLFEGKNYLTLDIDPACEPDMVQDLCQGIPLPEASIDSIICLSVLEHIYDPLTAVKEMHRVLRPGGKIFFYVPFLYADHSSKGQPDYYRYTRQGVEYLFRNFGKLRISSVRGNSETVLYLVPVLRKSKILTAVARLIDRRLSGRQTSGFIGLAEK